MAVTKPAEAPRADHVEQADHRQRLRPQHRVHAAQGEVARQVRGEEHELQPAHEEGQAHDDVAAVPARLAERAGQCQILVGGAGVGQLAGAAGQERGRQHEQAEREESIERRAPAAHLHHGLPERRGEERPHRAGRRDDAEAQAAPARHDDARGDVGGDAAGGARQRHADQHAGAQHDHLRAGRGRRDGDAGRIE